MSVRSGYYTSVDQIKGPSGWYKIDILGDGDGQLFYVDQSYDGGGWVCVLANRRNTQGMRNLTYDKATNYVNYRSNSQDVNIDPKTTTLANTNIWVGTRYWEALGGRENPGYTTVVQFVAGTNGTALSGSHTKRYRWRFGSFSSTYAFQSVAALSDETGTGAPGFYSGHASPGYSLTTYDNDQDIYGSNCSHLYSNSPWWYSDCWSGNYFAGGGYVDGPYWVSSTSDYHQYGAVYIR